MNNTRRKALSSLVDKLYELQSELEDITCEEQEALDNIPENLQGSERYDQCSAAVDALESAVDGLNEVINSIEEASE